MITLCMITKNEEKNIEACLKSAYKFVEEIIVVDTGSIDRTKEIALKYTNKVYDFQWCDDFSAARNFSITKASNHWILVLDADEIVESFDKKKIMNEIENNEKNIGRIKRINLFEDEKGEKKYIERVNRLFNRNHYHYEGIIHEQLVSKDEKAIAAWNIALTAKHVGYTKEVINRTNKIERNIELLLRASEERENDPYIYYQLGKSYFMKKDFLRAGEYFNQAIGFNIDFKLEYVKDLIESYGYALINCKKFREALDIKKYEKYYGYSPDFNFLYGLICMNNAMFSESVNYFKKCIGEVEGSIEGVNSFLPNYNIGVIYECLGYTDEALEYYGMCEEYLPAVKRIDAITKM